MVEVTIPMKFYYSARGLKAQVEKDAVEWAKDMLQDNPEAICDDDIDTEAYEF
jgi:hypothetical protein